MDKNRRDVLTALIDAGAVYLATHPHAVEDARRRFWYYSMVYSRKVADYTSRQYRSMCP